MLAPADRNPGGAQADYEQTLAWYARNIPEPLKELFLHNFDPVRSQLGVRIARSQLLAGDRDAALKTAELLCHYLVTCGDDAADVMARFEAHARTLPILDLPPTFAPDARALQVVIGLWADFASLDELRAAIDIAGGEALRAGYRAEVDRITAEDLSRALSGRYESDQLPPTVLVLLPYEERLFVLPESRIAAYAERRRAVSKSATWKELHQRTAHLPPWAGASVPLEKRSAGAITDEERAKLERERVYADHARDMWNQFLFYPFRWRKPLRPGVMEHFIRRDRELWVRRELERLGFKFVREGEGLVEAFPELANALPAAPLLPDPFWEVRDASAAAERATEDERRAAEQALRAAAIPDGPFVVDEFDGSVVVMPASEARRLAALNDAIEQSQTWGEFLARVEQDQATQEYLSYHFGDDLPAPDEQFDSSDLPGFDDGDWPAWPKQKMLDWLPDAVQTLGSVYATAINGDALHIDEALLDAVIDALAAEGIDCSQDADGIVQTACGAWRYGL